MAEYPGGATWEFKAVVSPRATAGPRPVSLKDVRILVCDDEGCLPPRKVNPPDADRVGRPRGRRGPVQAGGGQGPAQRRPVAARALPQGHRTEELASRKGTAHGRRLEEGDGRKPVEAGPPPEAEGPKAVTRRLSADRDHAADLAAVAEQLPRIADQLPKSDNTSSGF